MKIVIAGPKASGKTQTAKELTALTGLSAVETDRMIESRYQEESGEKLSCREIFQQKGETFFRDLEKQVAISLADVNWQIIVCGGSTLLNPDSRKALRNNAMLIYLTADPDILWQRMEIIGLPSWLQGPDGRDKHIQNIEYRREVLIPFADAVIDSSDKSPEQVALEILDAIRSEITCRMHSANTFGDIIRITTFGESHGQAIGVVMEGLMPGLDVPFEEIQKQLNRRRPGQSDVTTPRDEKDQVNILSGVFESKTTGTPLAMIIYSKDQDSSKYEEIRNLFRPGHADFSFYKKYGIRDHRGGGRSSGRETAARVMGGAVAKTILEERGVRIIAHSVEIAGIQAQKVDYDSIEKNLVRCADPDIAPRMQDAILAAKDEEDSVGGVIELDIHGLPAGLGDPVFGKLDARLAYAIMTVGAIKGLEIGRGFELTKLKGSQSNDPMKDGIFASNNAGGIIGGISTGQPVKIRIAVKPTSSIAKPQETINLLGENVEIETHGRHDPCIVPRVIPVIESMAALVLLDAWQIQQRIRPDWDSQAK